MKKRILVLALGLALVTGVTACGKNEEDTTASAVAEKTISLQQEIVNFVGTDLPGIAADRDAAVKIYNAYFAAGADQDSEKWMNNQKGLLSLTAYGMKPKKNILKTNLLMNTSENGCDFLEKRTK